MTVFGGYIFAKRCNRVANWPKRRVKIFHVRTNDSMTNAPGDNLSENLLKWYDLNKRRFPWRSFYPALSDPYHVVVSEMMLQQTTVTTVIPYFLRFIERFQTLEDLAKAKQESVYAQWQGLGYYRRARFLHSFAQIVMNKHQGQIPQDEHTLRSLPGMGPYTSKAVCAIAFNKPTIGLDGNIIRVLGRYFHIELSGQGIAKILPPLLSSVIFTTKRFCDLQQALMDLGSSLCTPRSPSCEACPLNKECLAFLHGAQADIPVKTIKKPIPHKYGVAFVMLNKVKDSVLLEFRENHSLLQNLWGFPTNAWSSEQSQEQMMSDLVPSLTRIEDLKLLPIAVTHTFTHFKLTLTVYQALCLHSFAVEAPYSWVPLDQLNKLALPTLMRKIQKAAGIHARDRSCDAPLRVDIF